MMNSNKNLHRLKKLHQLIRSECTGTPYELSRRLHVSERLVYLLVEQLRDFDALIDYDRSRQTYYYRELFDLEVDISVRIYNNDQMIFSALTKKSLEVGLFEIFIQSFKKGQEFYHRDCNHE